MAEREPTRTNSPQAPASDNNWLDTSASEDSVQSETLGFDFDLSAAIDETLISVSNGATPADHAELPVDDIVILSDDACIDDDPLAMPATLVTAVQASSAGVALVSTGIAKVAAVASASTTGVPSGDVDVVATVVDPAQQPQPVRTKNWSDRLLLRSVPSWLVSMILHMSILMTLAAIQIEPVRDAIGVIVTAVSTEDAQGLDEGLELTEPSVADPAPAAAMEPAASSAAAPFSASDIALTNTASLVQPMEATVDVGNFGALVENIVPSSSLNASASRLSGSLVGRSSGSMKSEMLERYGGNAASEKSVAMALDWLARHQDRSGGWTIGHSVVCRGECRGEGDYEEAVNGATAMALLPFLGAGQTHLEGKYKTTVLKGLTFLISRMKVTNGETPHGSWHEPKGSMYSHGLASIVVCEAYAMTRDPNLLQPAQLAINFIAYAQDPRGGGWRYQPKQAGDTSAVGWQLMALKSGAMGNLVVPPDCFRKADSFLNFISVNDGAFYGYDAPSASASSRPGTTAVGLLCRMYLGWPKDKPGLKTGIAFIAKRGPNLNDLYYSYYATQVLRQYGGPEWTNWNKAMRDMLIKAQEAEGHAAGSWYMEKGSHVQQGGRLYCTALSTMILEVYYRHMPLYSDKSSDDKFEF